MQHLTVPVDIPEMQVVHTARLKRIKKPSASSQIDTVPIGEGVAMELTLTHTRIWSDGEKQGQGTQALDFCFEIPANPEMWIIGGQKRVHFSAQVSIAMRPFMLLYLFKSTGGRNEKICAAAVAAKDRTSDSPIGRDPLAQSCTDYGRSTGDCGSGHILRAGFPERGGDDIGDTRLDQYDRQPRSQRQW